MCGSRSSAHNPSACVPLPEPGPPSSTRFGADTRQLRRRQRGALDGDDLRGFFTSRKPSGALLHRGDKIQQPGLDLSDRAFSVDEGEPARCRVVLKHWAGHAVEDPYPRLHELGGVVRSLVKFVAADVAESVPLGRM